jgi:DNA polymerase-1
MSLIMGKLEGVEFRGDKFIAVCPACREQGADKSGDHLVVYPDGRFGCVVHPRDELHRRRIWWLAGDQEDLPDSGADNLGVRAKSSGEIKVVKRVSFRGAVLDATQSRTPQPGTDATGDSRSVENSDGPTGLQSSEEGVQGTDATDNFYLAQITENQIQGTTGSSSKETHARSDSAVVAVPGTQTSLNANPSIADARKPGKALFRKSPLSPAPRPTVWRSKEGLGWIAAILANATRIALDIETYGTNKGDALDPWRGEIRFLSLRGNTGGIWLIDLRSTGYDLGPLTTTLEEKTIIAHNAKFDLLWLRTKCGLNLQRVFCTLTASRLLAAGLKLSNKLDDCLERHLEVPPGDDQSRSDWGAIVLTEEQLAYAARDVTHLHGLARELEREITQHKLQDVWDLERALLPHVVDMEASGIAVDADRLASIRDISKAKAEQCVARLRESLDKPDLNPASPAQLLEALHENDIPLESTSEEELKAHDDGRLIPLILAFRGAQKRAQQAASLLAHVRSEGRIHGRFEPTGTATGRFSSRGPNLQNVNRGELREAFIAPSGRSLIVADYSQVELRAAAAIAGEDKMIEAYHAGKDLHTLTAAAILGRNEDEIDKSDRQLAKAVNFGLLYGQYAPGLVRYASASYGVQLSREQAEKIRGAFFRTYSKLFQWHTRSKQDADSCAKEARTRLGRRRLIPGTASSWNRFTALVNMPVQGGTADGMKKAIILVAQRIPEGAHLVATVHDEMVVECREEDAEAVKEILIESMTEAMAELFPEVPIEVEANICSNWGEK